VLNKATKILANSKYTAKAIESCGIPEDKIQTVYRGINTKKFDVKPTEDKYTNHSILFVGGNMERKGGKYLIQAAPSILRDFPDSTFILIGRTSWMYRQLLNRYIKKYNLRKKAKILDYVAPNELRHFYARANVFVMPAIVEALGQVFMEAMMSKTPVIGSNVGGIPENISDGETGFLVKPKDPTDIKDKVFKVFEDPTMAKKMGEMGHRRVLRLFSLEKMINETIRVYQDAITIFKGNLR
jgi:glycosyltransferase involved in cell wall biosynthesis